MKLNPNLRDFWRAKADIKVLKGGRSSSKTHDAAGNAIYLAANYTIKFLCLRTFQNRIEDSVYDLLITKIEEAGYTDEFIVKNNSIEHKATGSSFHFYGINRNLKEIKGFEGADICWLEEAESLTKAQWEVIEPTIRKEGSEIWILYNPDHVLAFVEQEFKHDPENGVIVRHINYDENPFLSQTMLRKIERAKARDYDDFVHVYLGTPKTDDDKTIIKLSRLKACIDAHLVLEIEVTGSHQVGYDVADSGKDENATVETHGVLTIGVDKWKGGEDELLKSCTRTYNTAEKQKSTIVYDSIGVGATAGAKFKELNQEKYGTTSHGKSQHIEHLPYNAGGAVRNPNKKYQGTQVLNKDMFENVKAQDWWDIGDRVTDTYNWVVKGIPCDPSRIISISSECKHIDQLIKELATPFKDVSKNGRVKVESKEDLARRDIASPNLADAFIMANTQQTQKSRILVV